MEPAHDAARGLGVTFDRGTLVVRGAPGELDALAAHGLLRDPRVGGWRAPAYRYRDLVEAAVARGLRVADGLGLSRASGARAGPRGTAGEPALRPYQRDALDAWAVAGRRGVVVLPTGAGKTHVALAAVARCDGDALVLVPTRVLLEQWARRVREVLGVEAARYGDGEHGLGPLTVCTFESAFRNMDRFGDRFRLLVVDEAHHFGGGLRSECLEMCPAPHRLGLTATPPDGEAALEVLERLVGPVVFEVGIGDLAGTHLAPFEHVLRRVTLEPDEASAYARAVAPFKEALGLFRASRPDGTWGEFVRAAVEDLLRHHAGDRTLAFTADNAAAYALSRALLLPAITCDIPRDEREQVLADFRAGRVRALVSARVLNEGIDVPDAEVGVVLGGSLGPREHVQRVGRLLRPAPGKVARVYEVVVRDTFEDAAFQRRRRALAA